jgi:hypothetical protein
MRAIITALLLSFLPASRATADAAGPLEVAAQRAIARQEQTARAVHPQRQRPFVNRAAFIPPKRDIIPPGGGAVLSTLSQGPTGSGPDSRQVVFTNLERRPWFTRTSER